MRVKQDHNHKMSRRGYARLAHMMGEKSPANTPITRSKVWIEAHKKKNGQPSSQVVGEKMREIEECPPESLNTTNIDDDAISFVFGKEARGRVRGMGFGVTPSKAGACIQQNGNIKQLQSMMNNFQQEMQEMRSMFLQSMRQRNDQEQMRVVCFEESGGPEVLQIKEVRDPTVKDGEIMIQVAAAGLDIYDSICRQGITRYNFLFTKKLGYECSGTVVAIGSKVAKFKEGDEVCTILTLGGGYAEFIVVPEFHALLIPSGVPLVHAAALPLASHVTFCTLSRLTDITAGKIVLIHEAAGGVGTIALQYAKHVGCEVFAVAGTEQELQVCQELGANVCINYKKHDFCKCVKSETGDKGVDIILDLSERDHFQKNLCCLARGGSLVTTRHGAGSRVDVDLSVLAEMDISVIGGALHALDFPRRESLQNDVAAKFWPLIEAEHIKPIISKIFTFSEAEDAHRALDENRYPGKMLLIPGEATLNSGKRFKPQ